MVISEFRVMTALSFVKTAVQSASHAWPTENNDVGTGAFNADRAVGGRGRPIMVPSVAAGKVPPTPIILVPGVAGRSLARGVFSVIICFLVHPVSIAISTVLSLFGLPISPSSVGAISGVLNLEILRQL